MSSKTAILFDLDGTLIDSAPDIAAALNEALAEASIPPLDLDQVRTMVGAGARILVERALDRSGSIAGPERVLSSFLVSYRRHPARLTTFYPGVREALQQLTASGHRLAVCTNKPSELTQAILDALDLSHHFRSVAASTPGLALKPAPDLLRKALGELNAEPHQAVMIGDSAADVGAARATGCRCVLVRHGYSNVPVDGLGADAIVSNMGELTATLHGMGFVRSA